MSRGGFPGSTTPTRYVTPATVTCFTGSGETVFLGFRRFGGFLFFCRCLGMGGSRIH